MSRSTNNTCSSSVTTFPNYDVFISFRGKDTRLNFTDHLFGALQRKGIVTFRDDTKLKKGESIAPELLRAIEASQVFIVVFSKNYASSTWCLRELEHIVLHCVQLSGKRVLPVFCDVDPSHVRHQIGNFGEAFAKHEERFKHDSQIVGRWRNALTHVANLSGWDLCHKPQYAEIEKIVQEIINILGYNFTSVPKDLVGMDARVEELEKLLLLDSVDEVRVVGICGMGGIGKTTLATVLYGRISHQFGACCFIDDVSKIYRLHDGPVGVQKLILHQTLGEEHLQIWNCSNGTSLMQSRLRRVRALIFLDNIDQVQQLEKLVVNREWLGEGSRIIITSRDQHILEEYGMDVVYKVPLLNLTESRQLFCRKAFKLDNIMSNYEKLAYDILFYANGLPLAIKVLGSLLFRRNIPEWRSALARLRESPNKDIMDVLRLSFDMLEETEKEIFLHIACFFDWRNEKYVKNILNCCGFHADIGLRVLIDKSLISITEIDLLIKMHDLLQELGRNIVQENSIEESRKWSRLSQHEHFNSVVLENMEENVEALVLSYDIEMEIWMVEALSKMSHLKLLILERVNFSRSLSCLSNELRYVEWHEYPFMYLPSNFHPNQLVELILKHSGIKQLWKGKKCLPNLRNLDLSHSKNLIKMPDFGEIPNLERLNLEGCVKLVQIDPSIGVLRKLVSFNLKDCKNLVTIPNNISWHLERLNTTESDSQTTSSIWKLFALLPFHYMYSTPSAYKELLPSLPSFYGLRELDISFCGLSQLPDAIGCIHWLEKLNLEGNNFVTVPSLTELSKLVHLNLQHCIQLEHLPDLPSPPVIKPDQHWKRPGMYIFNCPNLVERERCSDKIFLWMKQFIQANKESSTSFDWIDIVIPEREIPSWFNNQSEDDLIRIDCPIMHDNDNNFIGIICCVVFSFAPTDPTMTANAQEQKTSTLSFRSNNTGIGLFAILPAIDDGDLITARSTHMCIIYIPRKTEIFDFMRWIGTKFEPFDDFKFIVLKWQMLAVGCSLLVDEDECMTSPKPPSHFIQAHFMSGEDLDVEVKSCGYHWVYKQDLHLMHLVEFLCSEGEVFGKLKTRHNRN